MVKITSILLGSVAVVATLFNTVAAVNAPTAVSKMCTQEHMWLEPTEVIYCGNACVVQNVGTSRARILQDLAGGFVRECQNKMNGDGFNVGVFHFEKIEKHASLFNCNTKVVDKKTQYLCSRK